MSKEKSNIEKNKTFTKQKNAKSCTMGVYEQIVNKTRLILKILQHFSWKNSYQTFFLFKVVNLILDQPAAVETSSALQNT